jgi:hypothetical protein
MDSAKRDGNVAPPSLPPDWQVNEAPGGGADVGVIASRRTYLVAGAAVLAALSCWKVVVHWAGPSASSAAPWLGATLSLGLFGLWCAFGDEVWHVEANCLVHRVGVGRLGFSRRYHDAALQIILRYTTSFSRPYYRLYVVADGESHFLIERSATELQQLAAFISFHTGRPIRPVR